MSFYDFSGYALDNGEPRGTITAQPKQESKLENFLNDAWSVASELHAKLTLAAQAQEEDDKAGEELDRTSEQFVERLNKLIARNGELQSEIMQILYEHNNRCKP